LIFSGNAGGALQHQRKGSHCSISAAAAVAPDAADATGRAPLMMHRPNASTTAAHQQRNTSTAADATSAAGPAPSRCRRMKFLVVVVQ